MRLKVGKRLACCTRDKGISIDFDEHQHQPNKIMTYDGLESCILNSHSYGDECETSREEGRRAATDTLEDEASSCSSNSAFMSFISSWVKDDHEVWDGQETPKHLNSMEKPSYVIALTSDVNTMKETFSKLLLGEDITGGAKGLSPALALSNAITNLAASVFGEMWKLEPLPEESKNRWHKEMDWFLSPAKHMVELVPAKHGGDNGHTIEIMTPKARADVHMNLPALQKLDCMLIDMLDSMVKTEYWYSEGSTHHHRKDNTKGGEGSERQSKRWWLPYPRVPTRGLSEHARKKLISQGNVVQQVFKASKSINQNILCEMPVPKGVKDALPKSGKMSLGEDLYNMLAEESISAIDMADSLKLNSEHQALEAINKLESAQLVWREYVSKYRSSENPPPARKSWLFGKDSSSNVDKIEFLLYQAENLLRELRLRYPHLPHTFLDMTKIQYNKDVAHLITEAYSRVLSSLAYKILLRIGDILQEDHTSNPTSPMPMTSCFPGMLLNSPKWTVPETPSPHQIRARRSLVDQMSRADSHSYFSDSNPSRRSSDLDVTSSETRSSSVTATPSGTRIWCKGGDGTCSSATPCSSP